MTFLICILVSHTQNIIYLYKTSKGVNTSYFHLQTASQTKFLPDYINNNENTGTYAVKATIGNYVYSLRFQVASEYPAIRYNSSVEDYSVFDGNNRYGLDRCTFVGFL